MIETKLVHIVIELSGISNPNINTVPIEWNLKQNFVNKISCIDMLKYNCYRFDLNSIKRQLFEKKNLIIYLCNFCKSLRMM